MITILFAIYVALRNEYMNWHASYYYCKALQVLNRFERYKN